MSYSVVYTKQAMKDAVQLRRTPYIKNARELIALLEKNPWQSPPPFEKLFGDLEGAFSRRISLKHRLVYRIEEKQKTVRILRLWTHYGD